ncbi:MAG: FtsX-like permease family protein [Saprospiraceae bacterium]
MIKHYLRFLLRKQPVFTALNFAGLVIGMAAALLLFGYVRYEQTYDQQSPHAGDIWRVFNQTVDGGTVVTQDANTHSAVGPALKADVPGVIDYARLYCGNTPEVIVIAEQQPYDVARCYMTDPGFLRMFPQQVIAGNLDNCLNEPRMAVLTQSQSERFFGGTNTLGKTFRIAGGMMTGLYTVAAVVKNTPDNTHLKFDLLLSYATRYANGHEDNFESYWDYNYFQLAPNADPESVRQKLAGINETFLKTEGIRLEIQRFKDIHLHSDLTYELEPNGSARTVQFLGLVALLILGIAFINFINLSTAFANERSKEVGIRKAIGASRSMLVFQFFFESILLSILALGAAVFAVYQLFPWFADLVGRPINVSTFDPRFWTMSVAITVLMAVVSGLYPAFQLSGFRPSEVLRGQQMFARGEWLRKTLVVVQFVCAVGLIFGVLVVSRQLTFLKKHEIGAQIDQIVTLKSVKRESNQDTLSARKLALLQSAGNQIPGVEGIAFSSMAPGIGINGISGSNRPIHWTQKPDFARITSYFISTDEHFFDLFGIKVLAGQVRFLQDPAARYSTVAINRTMLEALGFPSPLAAIGQQIAYENSENGATMTVGAVIEDFHIESLKTTPKPTMYYCFAAEQLQYVSLKIDSDNIASTLSALQGLWANLYPEMPFRYWFLDEHFAQQYSSEAKLGKVFGLFAALAILISCLGLLSLTAYNVQHRRKEIGIRKVLGASTVGITGLLSKDLLKLIFVAILIASPIAYYLMNLWLVNFAYRIDIQWWMFVLAGVIALTVAFLTMSFQSVRAALANPVKSLRSE